MGQIVYLGLGLLSCLLFNPTVEGVEASSCPPGWIFYGGHCYGFFQDKMTWAEAEMFCQSLATSGHLASVSSPAEGAALARYIQTFRPGYQHVWIGLHDPHRNRHWRWSDRSTVNYKAWNTGEPNNSNNNEYCVELWCDSAYLAWNDENCRSVRSYVCKFAR